SWLGVGVFWVRGGIVPLEGGPPARFEVALGFWQQPNAGPWCMVGCPLVYLLVGVASALSVRIGQPPFTIPVAAGAGPAARLGRVGDRVAPRSSVLSLVHRILRLR